MTREGRLWAAAAALVAVTYSTLYWARTAADWLRGHDLLRLALGTLFAIAILLVLGTLWRARPGPREVGVLAAFGAVYLGASRFLYAPEEAFHFLQYGLLGGLLYAALLAGGSRRLPGWLARHPTWAAGVATAALGWGDEGIQALLPNRYYDLRDVAFNALAGATAIGAMVARRAARRRDRQARALNAPR